MIGVDHSEYMASHRRLELVRKTANLVRARQVSAAAAYIQRQFPTIQDAEPFFDRLAHYLTPDELTDLRDLSRTLME